MLLNKRPGLVVHADETEKVNTLINHIQAYLYQKREWNPRWENAFTPALCNRIDRNTGGIVIAAKNAETLRIINEKIRDREIDQALPVHHPGPSPAAGGGGSLLPAEGRAEKAGVRVPPAPSPAARPPSPATGPWRPGGSCPCWRWSCSRAAPTRSAPPWPTWAAPCWGTANTATAEVNRRYGETRQALYSYQPDLRLPHGRRTAGTISGAAASR